MRTYRSVEMRRQQNFRLVLRVVALATIDTESSVGPAARAGVLIAVCGAAGGATNVIHIESCFIGLHTQLQLLLGLDSVALGRAMSAESRVLQL